MAYAADLCGSKLRAKLSSTLNEASAEKISSTSFAAKQMAKMGWKEGTGLGKKRDGIVSHIKVNKREENMGLGVEKERTRQMGVEGMWWSSNVADTLMKLQQKSSSQKSKNSDDDEDKKSKKKKDKKSKKSKKDRTKEKVSTVGKIYTEDELFEATGGARFGTKGGKRSVGKWKRSESSKELKDWEEEVKDKVEWNGLGKANVILSDKHSNKKRKRDEEKVNEKSVYEERNRSSDNEITLEHDSQEASNNNDEIEESTKKAQKKKRKSEKKSKKKKKDDR